MPYANRIVKFKQWTPREVVAAQTGRQQGLTNKDIGVLIGRSPKSVKDMFLAYGSEPLERFLQVRERLAEQRRLNGIKGSKKWAEYREEKRKLREKEKAKRRYSEYYQSERIVPTVTRVNAPPHVIAERDRRAQEYRTPQQILMGDPSPERSALGRRCD